MPADLPPFRADLKRLRGLLAELAADASDIRQMVPGEDMADRLEELHDLLKLIRTKYDRLTSVAGSGATASE